MNVLIGFASRSGAARDVATIAGETLTAQGRPVRIVDLRDQPDLDGATLVIVGSGIEAGHWYPEATAWLRANVDELRGRRVAVYNACLNAAKPEKQAEALAYNRAALELLPEAASATFPGRFVPAKVGFFRRVFLRAMQQQPHDHLNPDAVRDWARQLS